MDQCRLEKTIIYNNLIIIVNGKFIVVYLDISVCVRMLVDTRAYQIIINIIK